MFFVRYSPDLCIYIYIYIYRLQTSSLKSEWIRIVTRPTNSIHSVLHASHKTFSTLTSNFVTKSNPLNFVRVRHNAALQIQNSKFSPNTLLSSISYSVTQPTSHHLTFFIFPKVYLACSLLSPEGPTGATCELRFCIFTIKIKIVPLIRTSCLSSCNFLLKTFKDEAQTTLFKGTVRTAQ
jgi:hypothetical protein